MDGTEDDLLWKEDSDQSDTDDDEGVTDYSGWDHDEKISEEEWIGLFGLSDEDLSDFEGLYSCVLRTSIEYFIDLKMFACTFF